MLAAVLKLSERQSAALSGDTALKMISATADLTLLVDDQDIIREVSSARGAPRLAFAKDWIGRRWGDIVTGDSRAKVERLLREARDGATGAARQVNHTHPDGIHVPLLFSAVEIDDTDEVIALARDMSPMAQMQQRLVSAQQALERDYARLIEMERRYRTLFQVTSNGVLVIAAATGEILEANTNAVEMLAPGALRIAGRRFPEGFDRTSTQAISAAMASVQTSGATQDISARTLVGEHSVRVSLNLFHESATPMLLVRITSADEAQAIPNRARLLADCLQGAPDAFVTAGPDGRILHANSAFVDLAQAGSEEEVRRQPLDHYLGRSQIDMEVLLASLKGGQGLRMFATTLRGEQGAVAEVEISAVSLTDRPAIGFFIHNVSQRLPSALSAAAGHVPDQAADLVGRLPLKDIVGRTSDAIEEICIAKALQLTGDNRAAAAEILGLSRQTLYAKLRRLGIDAPGED